MGPRFHVHEEVAAARTLDVAFYLDPAVFETVRERIFARTWQWLGDGRDVSETASLSPRTLLPGLIDEPLLLSRDEAGTLRCLSNVCTHRGNLLITEACRAEQVRCSYHSRRFDLGGRMLFMPGFEGAQDFPCDTDHLPSLPIGNFCGHLFTSLQPAATFDAVLGDVSARLAGLPIEHYRPEPSRSRDFTVQAHWALYVENYLEGLHIPFLHPALHATLDPDGYHYELFRHGNLQLALARDGEPAFEGLPAGSPEAGRRVAAYYFWVFPNLMLNFYPWGLSVNLVLPQGPARTRVLFRSYVHDERLLAEGAGGALDTVEMEDEAAVEAVQRGLRARLYRGGRYSPRHERGVHQFHRLICEYLG